jgi:hypothetical protein
MALGTAFLFRVIFEGKFKFFILIYLFFFLLLPQHSLFMSALTSSKIRKTLQQHQEALKVTLKMFYSIKFLFKLSFSIKKIK